MRRMSTEKTSYTGGCHCQKVRFNVQAELGTLLSCNCSICSKRGALLAFVPASDVQVLSGEDELQTYKFNKMHIAHKFCKTCGILPFANANDKEGKPTYAINARCLDGVDVKKFPVHEYDGASV